jgi:hypothetical protein
LTVGLIEPRVEDEATELEEPVEGEMSGVYVRLIDVTRQHWSITILL